MLPITRAGFLTELHVRVIPPREWAGLEWASGRNGRKWELLAPLTFQTQRFNGWFVVPAGYRTDFASIPRVFWSIYPRDGAWLRAAVLHDAGYDMALQAIDGQRVHLVRRFCDQLFDEAMDVDGVPWGRRQLFLALVDLFGRGVPGLVEGQERYR